MCSSRIGCRMGILVVLLFCNLSYASVKQDPLDSLKVRVEKLATKDFDAAILLADKGISSSKSEGDKAMFYRFKGMAYYFKGEFEKASVLYSQAIRIFEKTGNSKELGLSLIQQAKLYRKTQMLTEAEKTYSQASEIFTKLRDTSNMATVLNESGVVYEYRKDFEKAVQLYRQAYELKSIQKDTIGMAYSLGFIAGVNKQQNDLVLAEKNLMESLHLFDVKKDSFAVAIALTNLAEISMAAGADSKAKDFLQRSTAYALHVGFKDLIANNYQQLATLYQKEGKTDSALNTYQNYIALNDSLYNATMQKTVLELNTQYETAKKDQEISEKKASLRVKNTLLGASVAALLLLGFLFYMLQRSARLKHQIVLQKTVIEHQDQATKAIIKAEDDERKRMSATLHDGLGQLLSTAKMNLQTLEPLVEEKEPFVKSYNNTIGLIDESIKEMRSVSHQIMPDSVIRTGLGNALRELIERIESPSLEINLNVEGLTEQYDQSLQIALYRIFQESINNVIKHAKANKLYISLIQNSAEIDVTIEDDGIGFNVDEVSHKAGIGLQNIKTRIAFLKGSIDISSEKGKGTLIAFHIPVQSKT